VAWDAAIPVAIAAILAAVVGAQLALHLPGYLLEIGFGLLLLAIAAQMARGHGISRDIGVRRVTLPRTIMTGIAVGILSALLGVGGGVIAIPMLARFVELEIRELAATSLAVVMCAALAGSLTYMLSGTRVMGLPPGSIGHVHLVAALPILAGSLLSVSWGARLNQRVTARRLRWVFVVLFAAVGLRLLVENLRALS
jgi:uncharacterized membrane protein YfcA